MKHAVMVKVAIGTLAVVFCQLVNADLVRLGAAETLGVFAWGVNNKLDMTGSQSGVYGRYGLGPQAIQQFTTGFITDGYWTDPSAHDAHAHSVMTTPGGPTPITPVVVDLSSAETDALAASAAAGALTATQTFGNIFNALTITRTTSINVIEINMVIYTGSADVLTLAGGPDDYFIVNVWHTIWLTDSDSAIQVAGGLPASHVLFNIPSAGVLDGLVADSGATLVGTYLVAHRGVSLSGSEVNGAVMAGNDIYISGGAVIYQSTFIPEPATYLTLLISGAWVILPCRRQRRLALRRRG